MAESLTWLEKFAAAGMFPVGQEAPSPVPAPVAEPVAVVRLSLPPSSNNLYANLKSGGRRMTAEGRAWCADAEKKLKAMRKPERYPVLVFWTIVGHVNPRRDGGNTEKILVDCLVKAKVLRDDRVGCVSGESWRYRPGDAEGVDVWWEYDEGWVDVPKEPEKPKKPRRK